MAVNKRSDQVFQLSLTEIAFTIVFILLLLLGYLVYREQTARESAEAALSQTRGIEDSEKALKAAKSELSQALISAGAKTDRIDEIISRLSAAQDVRTERNTLQQRVEDLDAQLSAMTELQNALDAAASKHDVVKDEVVSALTLQSEVRKSLEGRDKSEDASNALKSEGASTRPLTPQTGEERMKQKKKLLQHIQESIATTELLKDALKKQLDQSLPPGQEAKTIDAVVAAARAQSELLKGGNSLEQARKESADLRGQVAFYKRRLEARGGRDYPPCWATEAGSPEYIFSVELTSTGVLVRPSWPTHREGDARALPGIDVALQSPVSLDAFVSNVQGIFSASKSADPQCRHYVYLKSTIADAVSSDRARLTVEKYFYKNEARR